MPSNPTFFLSSTIYDFKDLRGAVKYELERRGCRVLASEHSDFGNALEENSYEACLKLIDQADYFVLFIGKRVGGIYDPSSGVSITRAEYRYAYDRHKRGLLKVIPFVRRDIWDVKSDRARLEKLLRDTSLTDSEVEEIVSSSSKFANDARHTFDFIDEVTRVSEFRLALKTGTERPTGNWIYPFENFSQVIEAIGNTVFAGESVEKYILLDNLASELERILISVFCKLESGEIYSPANIIYNISQKYPLGPELSTSSLGFKKVDFQKLNYLIISTSKKVEFDTEVLKRVLNEKTLHDFDRESGAFVSNQEVKCLEKLISELNRGEGLFDPVKWLEAAAVDSTKTLPAMPWIEIVKIYGESRRRVNIERLSIALLKKLKGHDFVYPDVLSTFVMENKDSDEERITKDQLYDRLGLNQ